MNSFKKLFLDHPATVNEGYFEHMAFAFKFSGRLFKVAFAALVHGAIPSCYESTASTEVLKLSDEIRLRRELAK